MLFVRAENSELAFEFPVEIFVRTDGFEIYQAHFLVDTVAQQVELSLAAELVNIQLGKVALFAFSKGGLAAYFGDGDIHIRCNVVMQLLVLAGEPPRLKDSVAQSRRLRGAKGVA